VAFLILGRAAEPRTVGGTSYGAVVAGIVERLRNGLAVLGDPAAAVSMRRYMKSAMPFRGVAAPPRATLLRTVLAECPLAGPDELGAVADTLWDEARFREERYLALGLVGLRPYAGWPDPTWVPRYRGWIVTGAWWDLVDEIASRRIGALLLAHREELTPVMRAWAVDPDPWLRRTSIICQLQAKGATDLDLLSTAIEASIDDPGFFLRKGIGWALRQYARTDPEWVRAFVHAHRCLSPLSRKEALKHL
jgi:3-methyladenine DNA glycosylase AlkD